jgi:hypothetical protein
MSRWPSRFFSARTFLGVFAAISLAAVLTGCSVFRREAGADPDRDTLTVEVRNQNYYDVTLHAIDGGARERIGVVTGNTTRTLTFRWQRIDLAFQIDLIGAGTYLTRSLPVSPGEVLQLDIRPDLHRLPQGTRIGE